jgi:hypothetical protein
LRPPSKDEITKLRYTINQKLAERFTSRIILDDLEIETTSQDLQVTYKLHTPKDDPTLTKSDWIKAEKIANTSIERFLRGMEDICE